MEALTSNKIKSYPLQVDERCIKKKKKHTILPLEPVESPHPRRKNLICVTNQQHNANTASPIKPQWPHFTKFVASSAKQRQTQSSIAGHLKNAPPPPLEIYSWSDLHGGSKCLRHSNACCTAAGSSVGNLYHTLHKLIWQRNKQSSYLHQLRWILCMSFMGPSVFLSSVEGGGCCCWCDASPASSRAAASWAACFLQIN